MESPEGGDLYLLPLFLVLVVQPVGHLAAWNHMSKGVIAQIDVKGCTSNGEASFLPHFSLFNILLFKALLQYGEGWVVGVGGAHTEEEEHTYELVKSFEKHQPSGGAVIFFLDTTVKCPN